MVRSLLAVLSDYYNPSVTKGYLPLDEARMGLAAGGRISQKVYKDTRLVSWYDDENPERLWVHTVTSAAWEVCLYSSTDPEKTHPYRMADGHWDGASLVAHCTRK